MNKENNNKEITNDELAQMVAKGFDGVDERFNEVEKKMATKDDLKKLEGKVDKGFKEVKEDIEELTLEVREVNKKLDKPVRTDVHPGGQEEKIKELEAH